MVKTTNQPYILGQVPQIWGTYHIWGLSEGYDAEYYHEMLSYMVQYLR